MSFTVLDVEQGSYEWRLARCGRLCASDAGSMLTTIRTGEAAARRDLRTRLVCERVTGLPVEDGFISPDMQRGKDLESAAVAAYEAATGEIVQRVGFMAHSELLAGYSPDGCLAAFAGMGLIEAKCPRSATHLRYLRSGQTVPPEHMAQVTHALWLTGAEFLDFFSFDPRYPEHLQLFIVRVQRAAVDVAAYELAVRLFLSEVEAELATVLKLRSVGAAA